ncbi:exported hypothetical protein [Actinacidiphila cocklensis]|uniref:Uncharacterized protein n=1 Tax=Actinacidiphila cocklensis TaxID=887465 RepID=A0A9W4EAT3_9ACTN|nr:exported hypothetical protein [Actinacidiphila cocklensis]
MSGDHRRRSWKLLAVLAVTALVVSGALATRHIVHTPKSRGVCMIVRNCGDGRISPPCKPC